MLRKLIKYDILADYKKYAVLCAAMLASSVLMLFFDKMTSWISNNTFIAAMAGVFAAIFFLICLVAGFMVLVLATVRFYKSVMQSEGYLTHTLPVHTWQVIASKMITVYIWHLLTIIMAGICSGIAFGEPMWLFKIAEGFGEDFRSGFEAGFNASIQSAPVSGNANEAYAIVMGMLPIYAAYILLSPLFAMASIYFSCALGNLFSKSKLAMSVLMYFLLCLAEGIIGALSSIFITPDFVMKASKYGEDVPIDIVLEYLCKVMTVSLVISVILSIGFLIGTERIFSKKLNLE